MQEGKILKVAVLLNNAGTDTSVIIIIIDKKGNLVVLPSLQTNRDGKTSIIAIMQHYGVTRSDELEGKPIYFRLSRLENVAEAFGLPIDTMED